MENKQLKDFNEKCATYLSWSYELWKKEKRLEEDLIDTYYWYDKKGNPYSDEELKFDSDWNWIMIVLEAIVEECSENYHFESYYEILDCILDLEKTKQAIYKYIIDNE